MIVDNIRYGFATNSSSTHSLAIWKSDAPIPTEPEPETFGWEWFTANTQEGKEKYLRSIFMGDASRIVGREGAVHMASLIWSQDQGENWFPDGVDLGCLHEFYHNHGK